jgi:hypothetical protein
MTAPTARSGQLAPVPKHAAGGGEDGQVADHVVSRADHTETMLLSPLR